MSRSTSVSQPSHCLAIGSGHVERAQRTSLSRAVRSFWAARSFWASRWAAAHVVTSSAAEASCGYAANEATAAKAMRAVFEAVIDSLAPELLQAFRVVHDE